MASSAKTVLILGHVWPEPDTSAAGTRMLQLIRSFQKAGYHLHFLSSAEPTNYSVDLEEMGVSFEMIPLNDARGSAMIREINPNLVLFDRFMTEEQFGWRVAEEVPHALRILNTEDLHSLRKARELCVVQEINCDLPFWSEQEVTLRELASILRSDLSLVISQKECEWLQNTGIIPEDILFYLPFMLYNINSTISDRYNNYIDRSGFAFVGYGKHAPNADAVQFLVSEIWPGIRRELPDANLTIYGRDYPRQVLDLQDRGTGIHIAGWIEDLDDALLKTRVNLAPLRFGAGLKGKVICALEQSTPSMMTSVAAEGIFPVEDFSQLISDDPEVFASKAVALYRDSSLWEDAVKRCRRHLAQTMDGNQHHTRLHNTIGGILADLGPYRKKHLLGRILHHHSMQSTRYMAKWIEAKNKA